VASAAHRTRPGPTAVLVLDDRPQTHASFQIGVGDPGGVGDRRERQVQVGPAESGDLVAEVHHDVGGADGGGDAQESLLTAGQGTDLARRPTGRRRCLAPGFG
jgi:hypothetical protein